MWIGLEDSGLLEPRKGRYVTYPPDTTPCPIAGTGPRMVKIQFPGGLIDPWGRRGINYTRKAFDNGIRSGYLRVIKGGKE